MKIHLAGNRGIFCGEKGDFFHNIYSVNCIECLKLWRIEFNSKKDFPFGEKSITKRINELTSTQYKKDFSSIVEEI